MSTREKDSPRDSAGKGPRMESGECKSRKRNHPPLVTLVQRNGAWWKKIAQKLRVNLSLYTIFMVLNSNGQRNI
ncbi:Cytoplasmic polyadenylation element-binding protein [Trichinella pseudospiralis]